MPTILPGRYLVPQSVALKTCNFWTTLSLSSPYSRYNQSVKTNCGKWGCKHKGRKKYMEKDNLTAEATIIMFWCESDNQCCTTKLWNNVHSFLLAPSNFPLLSLLLTLSFSSHLLIFSTSSSCSSSFPFSAYNIIILVYNSVTLSPSLPLIFLLAISTLHRLSLFFMLFFFFLELFIFYSYTFLRIFKLCLFFSYLLWTTLHSSLQAVIWII